MAGRPTTVRFWTWHNDGYVRLTLREDVPLNWSSRGPTDEGWSSRAETWVLEDGKVYCTSTTDGVDCDGRLTTSTNYVCPVADLAAHITPENVGVPQWQRLSARQRDYSAEAAGY